MITEFLDVHGDPATRALRYKKLAARAAAANPLGVAVSTVSLASPLPGKLVVVMDPKVARSVLTSPEAKSRWYDWDRLSGAWLVGRFMDGIVEVARFLAFRDGDRYRHGARGLKQAMNPAVQGPLDPELQNLREEVGRLASQGEFDVMELADRVTFRCMARLLGVDPDSPLAAEIKRHLEPVNRMVANTASVETLLNARSTNEHVAGLRKCFDRMLSERANNPSQLFGALARAARPTDGTVPQDWADDAFSNFVLLLVTGNGLTRSLAGNAVHAMLSTPGCVDQYRSGAISSHEIVQETLRWNPPLRILLRRYDEPAEVGGVSVGGYGQPSLVGIFLAGLHMGADYGANPEKFDPQRWIRDADFITPPLSFGVGLHACPGRARATLIADMFVDAVLSSGVRLAPHSKAKIMQATIASSIERLPVVSADAPAVGQVTSSLELRS